MAWVKKFGSAANSGGLGLLLEVGANDLHPTITIISCCSIIQNGSTFFCQLIQIVLATGCSTSEVVVAVTAAAVICRSILPAVLVGHPNSGRVSGPQKSHSSDPRGFPMEIYTDSVLSVMTIENGLLKQMLSMSVS